MMPDTDLAGAGFAHGAIGKGQNLGLAATSFNVDGTARVLAPLADGAVVGAELTLADSALVVAQAANTPANLMLLTSLGSGRYRVEQVMPAEVLLGVK